MAQFAAVVVAEAAPAAIAPGDVNPPASVELPAAVKADSPAKEQFAERQVTAFAAKLPSEPKISDLR